MGSQAIQITGQVIFNSPAMQGLVFQLQQFGLFVPITGQNAVQYEFTAPITVPAALPVSSLANLGVYIIINIDPSGGTIELLSATDGIAMNAMLNPGEFCLGRFPSNITAPALLSTSAAPSQAAVLIIEN